MSINNNPAPSSSGYDLDKLNGFYTETKLKQKETQPKQKTSLDDILRQADAGKGPSNLIEQVNKNAKDAEVVQEKVRIAETEVKAVGQTAPVLQVQGERKLGAIVDVDKLIAQKTEKGFFEKATGKFFSFFKSIENFFFSLFEEAQTTASIRPAPSSNKSIKQAKQKVAAFQEEVRLLKGAGLVQPKTEEVSKKDAKLLFVQEHINNFANDVLDGSEGGVFLGMEWALKSDEEQIGELMKRCVQKTPEGEELLNRVYDILKTKVDAKIENQARLEAEAKANFNKEKYKFENFEY